MRSYILTYNDLIDFWCHFQQYFSYILATSFSRGFLLKILIHDFWMMSFTPQLSFYTNVLGLTI